MLEKLKKTKKVVIVDGGFSFKRKAEQNCLNRQDRMDDPELNSFKSRARLRQETFNRRLNHSDALSNTLRHKSDKYKAVFEAVIAIVQTQTNNGSPSLGALRGSAERRFVDKTAARPIKHLRDAAVRHSGITNLLRWWTQLDRTDAIVDEAAGLNEAEDMGGAEEGMETSV